MKSYMALQIMITLQPVLIGQISKCAFVPPSFPLFPRVVNITKFLYNQTQISHQRLPKCLRACGVHLISFLTGSPSLAFSSMACILLAGRNLVHASDGPEAAKREISLWFREEEMVQWDRAVDPWVSRNLS